MVPEVKAEDRQRDSGPPAVGFGESTPASLFITQSPCQGPFTRPDAGVTACYLPRKLAAQLECELVSSWIPRVANFPEHSHRCEWGRGERQAQKHRGKGEAEAQEILTTHTYYLHGLKTILRPRPGCSPELA